PTAQIRRGLASKVVAVVRAEIFVLPVAPSPLRPFAVSPIRRFASELRIGASNAIAIAHAMMALSQVGSRLPLRVLVPLIVACALFMENLDATVLSTALPAIAGDLHQSPIQLKLALTSYLLTLGVFIPASGWVADRWGARLIFRWAILIFALGSALCGLANSMQFLVAARALQGIGGAMMVPVGRLVILRSVSRSEMVGALAWLTIPALIGPVLGPPLGGFITTYYTWRWIFWINLPIAALGLVLATLFIPNTQAEKSQRFDFVGFVLSGVALSTLVAGSSAADTPSIPLHITIVLFTVGIVCSVLYCFHAKRCRNPILDLSLLRLPTFRAGVGGGSLFRIGIGSMPLLLPLLFQLGFGFSPLNSGLMTFVAAIGAMGMKTAAGWILKKFGFRTTLAVNALLCACTLIAPAFFNQATPILLMSLILFVGGFFRSLQFTCINAITFAEVEQTEMSQATSFSSVAQQLSLSLGITVGAGMLQLVLNARGEKELTIPDFWPAFLIVGIIALLSLFSFLKLSGDAGEEVAGRKRVASVQVNISTVRSER
ncbi:MAG TPA: DHA2 family efflux MFS transporter permease subunit, partial [Chthoniobacterales bacterium]|nr:DHA2 family efflux MFS transporter permease subunit [Chthoniobacterales bacterium]